MARRRSATMSESGSLLKDMPRPGSSRSSRSISSVDEDTGDEAESEDLLFGGGIMADNSSAPSTTASALATAARQSESNNSSLSVPTATRITAGPQGGTRNALTVHDARCKGVSPSARFGGKTVVRRDTHLYVYGGAQTNGPKHSVLADAQVYRLNIASMQWRPLDDQGVNPGGGRFGHTLTLVSRDAMILHGGVRHGAHTHAGSAAEGSDSVGGGGKDRWCPQSVRQRMFLDNVPGLELCDEHGIWLLNVVDRTSDQGLERAIWSRLEEKQGSAHPSGRMHHTSTFVPAMQSLVIFGGTRPGEALNDLWMLNTKTMSWSQPETTGAPPSPRFGHTATLPLSPSERLDSLEDRANSSASEVKSVRDEDEEDLYGRNIAREKKTIMIMGGFTTSFSGRVSMADSYNTGTVLHLLDLSTMTWSSPQCFGSIPPPVGFHTANMTSGDSDLLLFGGETQISLTLGHGGGAAFVFDRLRWVWSRPQFNSSDSEPPSLHATANVMNKPVIFGGIVRRARLPRGNRMGSGAAAKLKGRDARPLVEVTDKIRLFNTVLLNQSGSSTSNGSDQNDPSGGRSGGASGNDDDDEKVKLIIVGDSGVGKSNLLMRFADDHFETNSQSTIGVDFKTCITGVGGQRVRLLCWDTAGQERYRTITSNYYRGADACLLVYDSTRMETAENLPKWFDAVKDHCGDNIPCLIVANKADKVAESEMESMPEKDGGIESRHTDADTGPSGFVNGDSEIGRIRKLAFDIATERRIPLMETSAKTSEGVDAVFLTIAARYLAYRDSAAGRSARRKKGSKKGRGGAGKDGNGIRPSALTSNRTRRTKNGCC